MARVHIGCSGFMYDHWQGVFYPDSLAKKRRFAYYRKSFDTVEMNVTFYRLVKDSTFMKWHDESPGNFRFSIKGSRYITHVKRLIGPEEPLKRFFDASLHLKEKLAVVLWQFPPGFEYNPDRLLMFLSCLKGYGVRNAFEFRHQSWIRPETIQLLAENGCALCAADWPEFNNDVPQTADFAYIRRHGLGGRYSSCYATDDLKKDAAKTKEYLGKRLDVFIYFNNDAHGYAPRNGLELKGLLEQKALEEI